MIEHIALNADCIQAYRKGCSRKPGCVGKPVFDSIRNGVFPQSSYKVIILHLLELSRLLKHCHAELTCQHQFMSFKESLIACHIVVAINGGIIVYFLNRLQDATINRP